MHKTDDLMGLFISHYHQDHFALCKHIDPEIPVYMAETCDKFISASADYLSRHKGVSDMFSFQDALCPFKNVRYMRGFETVELGAFKITPYPVDHAAYDAFAFLIQADGKRVFYSGDFRAHGRTSKKTQYLFNHPPKDIDVLLMEGSSLGRLKPDEHFETEEELSLRMAKKFREKTGLCMIHPSSQNVDRIVTAYRAAIRTNRIFVMTGYTGLMMMQTGNPNIPNFKSFGDSVRKLVSDKKPLKPPYAVTPSEIAQNPGKYVVVLGNPRELIAAGAINSDALYAYSMWAGYKQSSASVQRMLETMNAHNVEICDMHTSGHADAPTLTQMVKSIRPKKLVPIHTFQPGDYEKLFGQYCTVEPHGDNMEFDV